MKLFDNKKRTNEEPAKNNANTYDYLNNSSRKDVDLVRLELERWFERYSREEKFEIKKRLSSNEQFDSTFFEMYLYEYFSKVDFKIAMHPKMKNSTSMPDFLLSKNDKNIYVEAKVDYNLTDKKKREERKRNHLIDGINRIKNNNYRLFLLEMEILSENQPSINKLKVYLNEQFLELRFESKVNKTLNDSLTLKTYTYRDEDLYIKYKIIEVGEDFKDNRLIQVGDGSGAQFLDGETSLYKSLTKKKKKYGSMEAPFIIAINSLDVFLDEYDIENVIFGTLKTLVALDSKREIIKTNTYRISDGFFSHKIPEKNSNVSAVLIYKVGLGNIAKPKYWFVKNPNAKYPLEAECLGLEGFIFEND